MQIRKPKLLDLIGLGALLLASGAQIIPSLVSPNLSDASEAIAHGAFWGLAVVPLITFALVLVLLVFGWRVTASSLMFVCLVLYSLTVYRFQANYLLFESDWLPLVFGSPFEVAQTPGLSVDEVSYELGLSGGFVFLIAFAGLITCWVAQAIYGASIIVLPKRPKKSVVTAERLQEKSRETAIGSLTQASVDYSRQRQPANSLAHESMYVPNSGMSVAAFILALIIPWIGLIFAYVARNEIRRSGGRVGGHGLVKAALIIGWISLVLQFWALLFLIALIGSFVS